MSDSLKKYREKNSQATDHVAYATLLLVGSLFLGSGVVLVLLCLATRLEGATLPVIADASVKLSVAFTLICMAMSILFQMVFGTEKIKTQGFVVVSSLAMIIVLANTMQRNTWVDAAVIGIFFLIFSAAMGGGGYMSLKSSVGTLRAGV